MKLIATFFITVSLLLFIPLNAYAVAFNYSAPFGGRVYWSFYCTCSNPSAQILFIGAPSRSTYYYDPSIATTYLFRRVGIGSWLLGLYQGTGTCSVSFGNTCTTFTGSTIRKVGTSLY